MSFKAANLQNADLRGVRDLTLNQLSKVKSLYGTQLDPGFTGSDLKSRIRNHVFETMPLLIDKSSQKNHYLESPYSLFVSINLICKCVINSGIVVRIAIKIKIKKYRLTTNFSDF